MMSTFKYEVEKFDGKNDFNLWKEKIMAHLGNLEMKIEDEDQAIFLLNSLPDQLRDPFLEYKPDHGSKVLLGNNTTCDVVDVGVIKLKMWEDLERNLISLGAVVESGWIYNAQGGALDVMKGFLVVVKRLLYVLQENIVNGEVATSENKEEQVVLNSLQENNQKNDQEGGAENLQEGDADDEAEATEVDVLIG
ncbi:Hypothetical predicted protein [Olea europaea subsp. europaea]|uniref:Uncharacterized protein n=1 Tax=Olea europaea subsp. europaea TaxID=158383 RepID=A0A8S0SAJ2_OLEEU|nr:Hypothetical predicted protein [Olea europaea subsp. europaea]